MKCCVCYIFPIHLNNCYRNRGHWKFEIDKTKTSVFIPDVLLSHFSWGCGRISCMAWPGSFLCLCTEKRKRCTPIIWPNPCTGNIMHWWLLTSILLNGKEPYFNYYVDLKCLEAREVVVYFAVCFFKAHTT